MESMKQELVNLKASTASFGTDAAPIRDLATNLSSLKAESSKALSRTLADMRSIRILCF